jgi:hypothetical protein
MKTCDKTVNKGETMACPLQSVMRGVFYPVWKAMELPAEFGYTTLLWLHDFIGLEIILAH